MFSKESIPATGTSFGLDRITEILQEKGLVSTTRVYTEVSVIFIADLPQSFEFGFPSKIGRYLRKANISCDFSYETEKSIGKQIQSLVKRDVAYIIIYGSDEIARRWHEWHEVEISGIPRSQIDTYPIDDFSITIKKLATGEQRIMKIRDAVDWIKS
jgi:histidyl-tRNA synthetase